MTWDEENHLMGINDNGRIHQYTYDGGGERIIKSSGDSQNVAINGETAATIVHTDDYTGYVSPYFVISKGKFTKHYFEGTGRIVSKLGNGTFAQPLKITAGGVNYTKLTAEQQKALDSYVKSLGLPPGPPTQQGIYATPEFTGDPYPSGVLKPVEENQEPPEGWPRNPIFNAPGDVPGPPVQFGPPVEPTTVKSGEGFTGTGMPENDIFYFHPDHLGSTSYITDKNGSVSQHVEYIAFGEILFEEHSSSFASPYLFNGKELDRETNLSYYGARYYDSKTSLWLNVDPLATYNPIFEKEFYFAGDHNGGIYNGKNLNSYGYCYQNPILFYDPNGKQSKFWTRTIGAAQMVGGVVEAVVGGVGGVVTAETGVGAVVGYAILINGCDNTVTGFNQMVSGESQTTLLHKGVKATAKAAGADEQTADNWGTAADISTIALGGVGGGQKAFTTVPKLTKEGEGVYNVLTSGGRYIGQSKKFLARVAAHFTSRGKLTNFTKITEEFHLMSGSTKYEREIYEQYLINKAGGIDNLINIVNPVGGRFDLKSAAGLKAFAQEAAKVITKYNLPN